jgi:regulator of protease activity HflC (stomatin/prohibitin superfamily)
MSPWTFKVIFIGVLVLVIAAAVYLISCVYFIDRNTVGVRVDNGKVVEQLDPGYNFLPSPTETLVRLVTAPTDGEVDGLSVATSDNFAMVETKIKFTRLIHPEDAMSVIKTTPNYEQMI